MGGCTCWGAGATSRSSIPRREPSAACSTGDDYIEQPKRKDVNLPFPLDPKLVNAPLTMRATLCLGLAFDRERRMYIVANVQLPGKIVVNRVALYRTVPSVRATGALTALAVDAV